MNAQAKIAIKAKNGDYLQDTAILYANGSAAVHRSFEMDDLFTVTNIHSGFSYAKFFDSEKDARRLADYIATVPELDAIRAPADATKLKTDKPDIVSALRKKVEEIKA